MYLIMLIVKIVMEICGIGIDIVEDVCYYIKHKEEKKEMKYDFSKITTEKLKQANIVYST